MKIVINTCYGGLGLSEKAVNLYQELTGNCYWDIPRDDPVLIKVVEELGEEAEAEFADLKVVEIPEDVTWEIIEQCGKEIIRERSRTWN